MTEEVTVTKKGQVTIPKKVRERLGLTEGRKVTFEVRGKEAVLLPEVDDPLETLKKLRGEVMFSEEEIRLMIEDSRDKWSKLDS